MPDLAASHPYVVHFAIALLVAGVALRLIHLTGRAPALNAAAIILILAGTIASVVAVKSGEDAHSPVEQVPGSREVVLDHEQWGERTRNVFLGVSLLEVLGLVLARLGRAKPIYLVSAILGILGVFYLYQAAERGGRLVYAYAGGVGIRSGDPADVKRLLLAGLYHQAQMDRKNRRPLDAAVLFAEAARRFPGDEVVQLLAVESLLIDRKDPVAALGALRNVQPKKAFLRVRHTLLAADSLVALGRHEEARGAVKLLLSEVPNDSQLRRKLAELEKSAPRS